MSQIHSYFNKIEFLCRHWDFSILLNEISSTLNSPPQATMFLRSYYFWQQKKLVTLSVIQAGQLGGVKPGLLNSSQRIKLVSNSIICCFNLRVLLHAMKGRVWEYQKKTWPPASTSIWSRQISFSKVCTKLILDSRRKQNTIKKKIGKVSKYWEKGLGKETFTENWLCSQAFCVFYAI